MTDLSLVMPYYENPGMLVEQYRTWAKYPEWIRSRIEVVIVDDGSPESPAVNVTRPDGLPSLKIYRVLIDKPWNQHGARNLGAKQAKSPWMLMTDMDHVVPAETMAAAVELSEEKEGHHVYTFARRDAPKLTVTLGKNGEHKPHPNSFLFTKALYEQVGGYDEDFCGIYGTDGHFRNRLFAIAEHKSLDPLYLIRYSRDVIPDASTRTLLRKEGRKSGAKDEVIARKEADGQPDRIVNINFPWREVYDSSL